MLSVPSGAAEASYHTHKISIQSQPKPIKQGWVLKKASSGLFTPWREKYLVLTLDASRSGRIDPNAGYVLFIHDSRDLSKPPKHELLVDDLRVDLSASNATTLTGLRKSAFPFVLISNKRKFHLAAQTQSDRDEWLELLAKAKTKSAQRPLMRSSIRGGRTSSIIDDDAKSIYSIADSEYQDDDAASIVSGVSRSTATQLATVDEDSRSFASSRVDTLHRK
eukprot:jgi/Hompol1/6966/HPOL_000869-RA